MTQCRWQYPQKGPKEYSLKIAFPLNKNLSFTVVLPHRPKKFSTKLSRTESSPTSIESYLASGPNIVGETVAANRINWRAPRLASPKERETEKKEGGIRCFRFGANIRHADAGQHRNVRVPDAAAREQDPAEAAGLEKA